MEEHIVWLKLSNLLVKENDRTEGRGDTWKTHEAPVK